MDEKLCNDLNINIFRNFPNPLILVNEEGTIISVNINFENFTGFSKEEVKGSKKPYPWSIKNRENAIDEGEILNRTKKERLFRTKNGNLFRVDQNTLFLNNSNSKLIVWERRSRGEKEYVKLKKRVKSLERSNVGLKQFAYIASHDLREPLRIIKSLSQLFQMRYKDKFDERGEEYLNNIVNSVNKMENLVEDLLSFSRLQTQEQNFNQANINQILEETLENLESLIKENNAKIIQKNELPTLNCVRSQIMQLFQNLISNAIKFNDKKNPEIKISFQEKPNEWIFSIKDNGIGIEKKYFDKIFVAFRRLHSWDEYPGSGIGLSICKQIIENHGGKIWVESEVGKGSTFYFNFPKNT